MKEKFHAKRILNYVSKIRVADLGKGELHKEARNTKLLVVLRRTCIAKEDRL